MPAFSRIRTFAHALVAACALAAAMLAMSGVTGVSAAAAAEDNTAAAIGAPKALGSTPTSLALFYHPPTNGVNVRTVAQQLGVAIMHRGDESYRDSLRSAGFTGPALQYLMANEATGPVGLRSSSDSCGTYLYYQTDVSGIAGDFCSALHPDETNFLHNSRGERLYRLSSWQEQTGTKTVATYMMNPAAPGWSAYAARQMAANLSGLGYNGLYLDNISLSLEPGQKEADNSDGTVKEFASDADYRAAVVGFLGTVRSKVGSGATIWGNLISANDSVTDWDQYAPLLNGVLYEYYVDRWNGTYADPAVWETEQEQALRMLGEGKSYVMVAQGPQTDLARMRFALASYLLIQEPGGYFRYSDADAYSEMWMYDDYQTRLGSPLGDRYQVSGGGWQRDFACGSVSVDPAQHTGMITTATDRPGCAA